MRSLVLLFACFVFPLSSALAKTIIPAAPQLAASSYILMDASTGKVLVEHNADMSVPPASLTKMMTSYVLSYELAQGNVSKSDMVLVSKNAWAQNPLFKDSSLMWIEVGKQVSIADLHKGIIISSGNDASMAVAEHLANNEEAFVDVMNQHAELLSMGNTNFENAHGLPSAAHRTTARDLATLGRALISDFPDDYKLYAEKEFMFNNIKQPNRNRLLWWDKSVDGLKTGHTDEAGYCLVASAVRNDMRLISVIMGAKSDRSRARESQKLLGYGFRYYQTHQVQAAYSTVEETLVWGGEQEVVNLQLRDELTLTIPRGAEKKLVTELSVNEEIWAPIKKGQRLGTLTVSLNGEVLEERPLLAASNIESSGFISRLFDSISLFFHSI